MRKRLLYIFAVSALMAGCSKEVSSTGAGDECYTAEFSVVTDAQGSRSISYVGGEGGSVDSCRVQIWMLSGDNWEIYNCPSTTKLDGKHYTFSQTFVKNQKYQILVWVDKSGYYEFKTSGITSTEDACVSILPDKRNLDQTDSLDAFFACRTYVATAPLYGDEAVIYAKRPFAQLNIVTDDLSKLPSGYLPSTVSLSYEAPVSFNLLKEANGQPALGEPQHIHISKAPVLQSDRSSVHNILSMDYIFAKADTVLMNFADTVHYTVDIPWAFDNIPIHRNYRTNIVGSLLTVDNGFKIIVDPEWDDTFTVPVGE